MGQRYGKLAQFFRTGETFVYATTPALHESVINENSEADAMQRTMYMERMAEHRKAQLSQENTNIQTVL